MHDATHTIEAFLAATAARHPTPGGGSVSALTGALAAAMGEMVLNYSVNKKGLDPKYLLSIVDKFGTIDRSKIKDAEIVWDNDAWLEQDVEVLIPAAQENMINGANVGKIKKGVKIIAEGANGPTTPEADAVIKSKGIFMIPDFLANAGGVTCSYFEQVQCNMNYFWTKEEVLTRLDEKMTAAFKAVSELARTRKLYMRDAAYVISVSRVANACKDRGWV